MTAGGQSPPEGPPGTETRAALPDQGERVWMQGDDRGPPSALPRHGLESGPRVSRADMTCGDAGEGSACGGQRGEARDATVPACVRPPSCRDGGQRGRGVRFASEISYFSPPAPFVSDLPARTNRFAVLQVEEAAEGADSTEQEQLEMLQVAVKFVSSMTCDLDELKMVSHPITYNKEELCVDSYSVA